MSSQPKKEIDDVMYSYTTSAHLLESENKLLKETVTKLQTELNKFREPALMVCELIEIIDDKAIVKIPNGNKFLVNVSSDLSKLKSGDSVLCEQKNLTVIGAVNSASNFNVESFVIIEKPDVPWSAVGGLKEQKNDIIEVVELPLKRPELFKKIGIIPPKGILLYGPPGTGKTLLAKAVASSTNSTFIEIVASELVQKFIGEGAKLVKEIFELARQKAPAIIFIDELDAIAAKRIELGTSGEREVQRTFMQLLAELDGFKPLGDIKIIGCTNRKDILDPAIIRPGRLDRIIEVPVADADGVEEIFKIHSKNMKFEKKFDIKPLTRKFVGLSGAEIKAVVTEAGYFAIRDNRDQIREKDFVEGFDKVMKKEDEDGNYVEMFG